MKIWATIRDKIRRNRLRLICGGLATTLIILFLWPSIVISIKPGELGVLYARFRGGTQLQHTYEEGIHFIQPWNIMYIYDVRVQEETQNIDVLTVDGLTINVQISLRFQIIRDRLPALHQEIGPRYRDKVVLPIMNSAVRQTIGSYRPDDLYSTARQELQDQMLVDAVEEMGRIPILIQGFVVKTITLPEVLRDSIERKLVAEQSYLRYKYILLEEQQEARRKIGAATFHFAQRIEKTFLQIIAARLFGELEQLLLELPQHGGDAAIDFVGDKVEHAFEQHTHAAWKLTLTERCARRRIGAGRKCSRALHWIFPPGGPPDSMPALAGPLGKSLCSAANAPGWGASGACCNATWPAS